VVKIIPTLVVTDRFVGVCCSSLKKISQAHKRHCLEDGNSIPRTKSNKSYEAMVIPSYMSFPVNAEAWANITRKDWNPTAELVRIWVELCRLASLSH
jgi:hypothetical protein